jgi:hypothetical protein
MKPQHILPFVLMCIDLGAAIVYLVCDGPGGWRKVVYWLAAASLTYVVTF